MSYTPNTWRYGDFVTSTAMNHIEDGIVDNQFMTVIDLNFDEVEMVRSINKSYNDLEDLPFFIIKDESDNAGIYQKTFYFPSSINKESGYPYVLEVCSVVVDSIGNAVYYIPMEFSASGPNDEFSNNIIK